MKNLSKFRLCLTQGLNGLLLAFIVLTSTSCEQMGTFEAEETAAVTGGIIKAKLTSKGNIELSLLPLGGDLKYEIYMQVIEDELATSLVSVNKTFPLGETRKYTVANVAASSSPMNKGLFLTTLSAGEDQYLVDEIVSPNQSYAFQAFASNSGVEDRDEVEVLVVSAGILAGYFGCTNVEATTPTEAKIEFDYPVGAEKVTVYRNSVPIFVATDPVDTYFDKDLTPNEEYIYSCRATVGNEIVAGEEFPIKIPSPLEALQAQLGDFKGCISGRALGADKIEVTFEFPDGISNMAILRSGNKIHSTADKIESRIITDVGLLEGYTYKYECAAYVAGEWIVGSNILEITTLTSNPPTFAGISSATQSGSSSALISWGVTTGVPTERFEIYGKPRDSSGPEVLSFVSSEKIVDYIGSLSKLVNDVGDELEYGFRVLACSEEDSCSGHGETLPDTGAPTSPGVTEANRVDGNLVLTNCQHAT